MQALDDDAVRRIGEQLTVHEMEALGLTSKGAQRALATMLPNMRARPFPTLTAMQPRLQAGSFAFPTYAQPRSARNPSVNVPSVHTGPTLNASSLYFHPDMQAALEEFLKDMLFLCRFSHVGDTRRFDAVVVSTTLAHSRYSSRRSSEQWLKVILLADMPQRTLRRVVDISATGHVATVVLHDPWKKWRPVRFTYQLAWMPSYAPDAWTFHDGIRIALTDVRHLDPLPHQFLSCGVHGRAIRTLHRVMFITSQFGGYFRDTRPSSTGSLETPSCPHRPSMQTLRTGRILGPQRFTTWRTSAGVVGRMRSAKKRMPNKLRDRIDAARRRRTSRGAE